MTTTAASLYAAPNVTPRFWPVVLRNLLVWKKLAVPSVVGNIAEPLITLVAFGYGLGALVYALLTGRPPLAGNSLLETLALIGTAEPVPPRQFQLSISSLFEGVVLKMLAKRPEQRFQSADDLLAQLGQALRFQGVSV